MAFQSVLVMEKWMISKCNDSCSDKFYYVNHCKIIAFRCIFIKTLSLHMIASFILPSLKCAWCSILHNIWSSYPQNVIITPLWVFVASTRKTTSIRSNVSRSVISKVSTSKEKSIMMAILRGFLSFSPRPD